MSFHSFSVFSHLNHIMEINGQLNYQQGKNVGILAIEVYTPSTFVLQEKLESYYGVDAGKYTLGLGQEGLAVCGDCEDVNSLALTVVQNLLEKYVLQSIGVLIISCTIKFLMFIF